MLPFVLAAAPSDEPRESVPRVVHLGYFDAVLDGVMGALTFDELRRRLITVSNDLARYNGRRLPPQRSDPSALWTTTGDTLDGLMQAGVVASRPLPSRKDALPQHLEHRYTLTPAGRELLALKSVGEQRERLVVALFRVYGQFRRYLLRLTERPLFQPEFTESELDTFGVERGDFRALAAEVVHRLEVSPAAEHANPARLARDIQEFVERRTSGRSVRRKELLDTVIDGIARHVAYAAGINADATSLMVLHEWGRQFFLTGSSRYVADVPGGLLHWSASRVVETDGVVTFERRTVGDAAEQVVQEIGNAYRRHLREGTRLVEYYKVRSTAAFAAGSSNDLVDRVVAAMIAGQVPNPYGLVPTAGAHWSPPPSERPLRIGDRRYTLVTCTRDA
jgi:hypothetical protein